MVVDSRCTLPGIGRVAVSRAMRRACQTCRCALPPSLHASAGNAPIGSIALMICMALAAAATGVSHLYYWLCSVERLATWNDEEVKRFLRARQGDVRKATTMLEEHLVWRKDIGADQVRTRTHQPPTT